jgi:hypothetical protein
VAVNSAIVGNGAKYDVGEENMDLSLTSPKSIQQHTTALVFVFFNTRTKFLKGFRNFFLQGISRNAFVSSASDGVTFASDNRLTMTDRFFPSRMRTMDIHGQFWKKKIFLCDALRRGATCTAAAFVVLTFA